MSPPGAWYRLLALPILAALAAGIGVYASGAPLIRGIVIAVTAGTVMWLLVRALTIEIDPWPPEPELDDEHGRFAHLWEISGFEAALRRPEYLGRRAINVVRDVAAPVLMRRGIVLDDADDAVHARKLLGTRNFALLTTDDHGPVTGTELTHLVDRVLELATATGDGLRPIRIDPRLHPRRSRRSWRTLTAGLPFRRGSADPSAAPTAPVPTDSVPTAPAAPVPAAGTAVSTTAEDRS